MQDSMIKVKKLNSRAVLPAYGSELSAGADLSACIERVITVSPGETAFIPTGLAIQIPVGFAGLVYARSGLASKKGLAPANKVGVIDSDYRGEIIVALFNHGREEVTVSPGDRIAQLVITPVLAPRFCEVEKLEETSRGAGGFGSTGK